MGKKHIAAGSRSSRNLRSLDVSLVALKIDAMQHMTLSFQCNDKVTCSSDRVMKAMNIACIEQDPSSTLTS